jgi:hypothetical protein
MHLWQLYGGGMPGNENRKLKCRWNMFVISGAAGLKSGQFNQKKTTFL